MVETATAVLLFSLRVLFAGLVFVFLWAVVKLVYRDLLASTPDPSGAVRLPPARLRSLGGTRPTRGEDVPLSLRVSVIGRTVGNEICLPHPFVSATHAEIRFRDGKFWLTDMGSTNGTTLNEHDAKGPVALRTGDRIGIGDSLLEFHLGKG